MTELVIPTEVIEDGHGYPANGYKCIVFDVETDTYRFFRNHHFVKDYALPGRCSQCKVHISKIMKQELNA